MEHKENKYTFKQYMLLFAVMMVVIIIICMLPRFFKSDPEGTEGSISIQEDYNLEEDGLELTDGPTGGDGYEMYKETYTNGPELMADGLYLNASYLLLSSFEDFKRTNDGYKHVETLTYISGSFVDNDSQQTFTVMLNGNKNETLRAVYNKTERTLIYTK